MGVLDRLILREEQWERISPHNALRENGEKLPRRRHHRSNRPMDQTTVQAV